MLHLKHLSSRRSLYHLALTPNFKVYSLTILSNIKSMSSSTTSRSTVPVPRPSASLVVVNERNEILLVHRNPKASAFGGFHVSWLRSNTLYTISSSRRI